MALLIWHFFLILLRNFGFYRFGDDEHLGSDRLYNRQETLWILRFGGYYGYFYFFGLVSVGGSYFLFTKTWNWDVLLPASAVGMLSVSVLNLNNMRDMESDQKAGKKTVAQWLGFRYAMIYQIVLMQLPLIFILVFLMKNNLHAQGKYYAFIVMILFFPMATLRRNIMKVKSPNELDPFLKQVGIITLMMAVFGGFGD